MKKNKFSVSIIGFLAGVLLIVFAMTLGEQINNLVSGLCYGLGSAALGLGLGGILLKLFIREENNAKIEKKKKIDVQDERNQMIKGKSAVKVNKIMVYILTAFIMLISFSGAQTWLILSAIILLIVQTSLNIFYIDYYNKRL